MPLSIGTILGDTEMSTRIVQVPIYNRRFPTSVDYVEVTVPVESIPEQRRAIFAKLKEAARIARESSQGYPAGSDINNGRQGLTVALHRKGESHD